ncbi:protein translocase, SecG subunit [Halobacteroides halobius DSM 5150]|uniref:Protein-export membrane protein SecG n=1 Tax=Halobacteroides halobius (strain ATCC 35273 / DSM 5150 / MD-1) TaxID=748449 RepID=L0KC90_HALHC|nr:preprotein translocase subunit SecG [Halobacteroides halobius]AGB41989.1 protein translocase, SecG subunit [Halobacteroides halobius DSM 5150]
MVFFLKVLLIIVSITLIVSVLLQSGKSAGLGGIDGGATSLFGDQGRGLDQVLSKVTTVAAVLFMILSLVVAVI